MIFSEDGAGRSYIGGGMWYAPDAPGNTIIPDQTGFAGTPISLPPREIMSRASPTVARQDNVSAVNEPCRVVLGQDRIGAQLLTALLTTPTTGNLLIVVVWCRGPISSISGVTMNNAALPSGTLATHYLGTTTQAVDPKLVSAFSSLGITHAFTFSGVAYSVFEFPVGATIGEFHSIINGAMPYDPRNAAHVLADSTTWTYSANPALLLAHVISNTTYGMGGSVDWAGSTAAFNACDAAVTGEAKRTVGYTMSRRLDATSTCDILRAHAGCFIVRSAGKYRLVPDAVAASSATVSKATTTLIDKSVKWQLAGLMQQPNVVEVSWTDTSVLPWRTATAVYPANAVPPAGEDLRLTRIDLPGCQRYSQAMREAIERRSHGRLEPLTITMDTYAESLSIEPGDVYTLNDAGAFTGTQLRLLSRTMGRKGRFTLTGKKYDSASYSSAADAAPTYANTNLPSPLLAPPAVTNLVLSELVSTNDSTASPLSRIQATWTASTWPYAVGYLVTITDGSTTQTIIFPPTLQQGVTFISSALPSPQKYIVKVKVMSSTNLLSAETSSALTLLMTSTIFESVATIPLLNQSWTLSGVTQASGTLQFSARDYGVPPATRSDVHSANLSVIPDQVKSPYFDLGFTAGGLLSLPSFNAFTKAFPGYVLGNIRGYDERNNSIFYVAFDGLTVIPPCRYFQLVVVGAQSGDPVYVSGSGPSAVYSYNFYKWQFDLTGDSFAFTMPVTAENVAVTTSASATVTAPLANRYLKLTGVQATAQSVTQANPSYSAPVTGLLVPNTVNIDCYDSANARVVKPCSVTVFGVRGDKTKTDWARDVNGATAVASSAAGGYPASYALLGLQVPNASQSIYGWSSTGLPANIDVTFAASKAITEIVVIALRDDLTIAANPTVFETGTSRILTAFTVQYWTGAAWAVISGGTVTGNNKIMLRFPVTITTNKIRVNVTATANGVALIMSLQAIGPT